MSNGYRHSWIPRNWWHSSGSSTQSSHNGSTRRFSSAPSRASDQYGEPQVIHGPWIDESKLREVLREKYRGDYQLRTSNNKYKVYSRNGLTEHEINRCY